MPLLFLGEDAFMKLIKEFIGELYNDDIWTHAGSAAFFFFLAVIPTFLMICTILPFTPVSEQDFMNAVLHLIPSSTEGFVGALIHEIYQKSSGMLSFMIIFTLWSASKSVVALITGLNACQEVKETRNYFILRAYAMFYVLIFMIMVILSLVLMVFGRQMLNLFFMEFPQMEVLRELFQYLRYILLWGILSLMFVVLFKFLPNKRPRARTQVVGACFAATGWIVFSWWFGWYVTHFTGYSLYGSLATIIIIMIWMYFCMLIMLFGAEVNGLFDDNLNHFVEFKTRRRTRRIRREEKRLAKRKIRKML